MPLTDMAALPLVGLTAWQAVFDHGNLKARQRVLIIGAEGPVGGYAVQLAKEVRAHVTAIADPPSATRVKAAGADEVIGYTFTDVTAAVSEPVDLILNLAPTPSHRLDALAPLIRDGGKLVSTNVWMPTPSTRKRGVQGIDLFVRSNTDQLADLVARVSTGELLLDVTQRVTLAELPALHAEARVMPLPGKAIVLVSPA